VFAAATRKFARTNVVKEELLSKDTHRMKSSVPQILYTEDHADTRELVSFVLTRCNCKVTLADSDVKALDLARTKQFDLYLIDNWIAGGSGIELCKKLREFDRVTPVLFYSGAAHDSDKREAFASGAQGYLTKPVDNDELVEAVFRLISRAKTQLQPKEDIVRSPIVGP
jgi:DNA-binding response OmpR family regulator